jgi:hypothetical protein
MSRETDTFGKVCSARVDRIGMKKFRDRFSQVAFVQGRIPSNIWTVSLLRDVYEYRRRDLSDVPINPVAQSAARRLVLVRWRGFVRLACCSRARRRTA